MAKEGFPPAIPENSSGKAISAKMTKNASGKPGALFLC